MSVDIDKAIVCRLKHSGQNFEILVDPKKALEFRKGEDVDLRNILAYPNIYKDVGSAEAVPDEDLHQAFGTTDPMSVAEKILKEGDIQLTTEQRKRMVEQKKTQISNIISRRGVNPQTDAPHPPSRILKNMEKAGVQVDPFKDAELQVDEVVKALKTLLPIKFQRVIVSIRVQPQFAGRVYSILKGIGSVKKEKWLNDGSLEVHVEVLAGMQQDLYDKLASITHGDFESKIVEKMDM